MSLRPSFPLPNSQKPRQGPVGISVNLDFSVGDIANGDLNLEQQSGVIDFIQSIYINNSANAKSLSISFSGLNYNITVKAGRQGIFPVICGAGALAWHATSVGAAVVVPIILMNEQQPYLQWDAV